MATKKTRAPRTSKVPANETAAQKFKRLAENRMPKAIKALRQIAKLGGNSYERTQEQADKITETLEAELEAIQSALKPGAPAQKEQVKFEL